MHMVALPARQENADGSATVRADLEFHPDLVKAKHIIDEGLVSGGGWLDAVAVQDLLVAYGVPTVKTARVKTADEAAAKAVEFGGSVALKIYSPDITHKSDVGGVALDLVGSNATKAAADAMNARVAKADPKAKSRRVCCTGDDPLAGELMNSSSAWRMTRPSDRLCCSATAERQSR